MNVKESLAMGKVKMAIDRLASEYPLHAGILAQWRVEEEPGIETMAVGFRDGRLRLYFNAGFVEDTPMDQLVGVVHHEANHVLFEHVLHKPKPAENRTARTIAEEVTVNEWVTEQLPEGVIVLKDYPYLTENESTDARYGKLKKRIRDDSNQAGNAGPPGQGGSTPAGTGTSGGRQKAMPSTNGVPTVDDHSTWEEIRGNANKAKATVNMDIAVAWGNLSEEQKAGVGEPFRSIAEAANAAAGMESGVGIGIGTIAGSGQSDVEGGGGQVPWQVVLRRYVGQMTQRRPVFGRPPRRFPGMVGIIPGKGRFATEPKVMAVIDTSGSMSDPMLADISAELGLMAERYEVTVVECDVAIHAVYPYRPIKSVRGRGGTSFLAPLEEEFLRKQATDLVVYFTDGFGPAPADPPAVPVVWCITEGGMKPTSWGQEVNMKEPDAGEEIPVPAR